jgi:hypothetical protein
VPIFGNLRLTGALTGSQTLQFGQPDGNGVRPVTVPASSIVFNPIVINPPIGSAIRICVFPSGPDGSGKIDCDGGEPNLNVTVRQDHNTNNAPGSNGGLPQDPECNDTRTAPDGGISNACLESAVTTCNSSDPHMGSCNSPQEWVESGTFTSGHLRVVEYLQLRQVSNVGGDGQQCTGDDTYSSTTDLRVFLTTGTARSTIYDAKNSSNSLIDHMAAGQCPSCVTQVAGAPRACALVDSTGVASMKMVAAFPALDLDSTAGDGAVTIEANCQ